MHPNVVLQSVTGDLRCTYYLEGRSLMVCFCIPLPFEIVESTCLQYTQIPLLWLQTLPVTRKCINIVSMVCNVKFVVFRYLLINGKHSFCHTFPFLTRAKIWRNVPELIIILHTEYQRNILWIVRMRKVLINKRAEAVKRVQ